MTKLENICNNTTDLNAGSSVGAAEAELREKSVA